MKVTVSRMIGVALFVCLSGIVEASRVSKEFRRSMHFRPGGEVRVSNTNGQISVTPWDKDSVEVYAEIEEQERGGHADEMETSCMLALRPDLVKMDRAPREWRTSIPGTFGPTGIKKVHVGGKMGTPNGINGDATLATVAKGEMALAAMAQDIITFVEHFVDIPLPGEG